MKRILFVFAIILGISNVSSAEVIYLKDGRKVSGDIISQSTYSVKLNENGLPKIYYRGEIDRIEQGSSAQVPATTQPAPSQPIPATATKPEPIAKKAELVRRLLEANGARNSMNMLFQQLINQAPEETRAKLKEVLLTDGIIDRLTPIYEKYYSESELKDLITFYSSETGKKAIAMTPKVMEESLQAAALYFKERVHSLDQKTPTPK